MSATTSTNGAVYTPEAVSAMNRAYDEACDLIKASGASREAQAKAGERIMFLARNGETDARRLRDLAVQEVLGRVPAGRAA